MVEENEYREILRSGKTETLFVALMLTGLVLFFWQWLSEGPIWLTILFFLVFVMFLFYSLNYLTLVIRITPECLVLTFGVFTWKVACANIEDHYLDPTRISRVGGAGIHFTMLRGRYRAFFNFLEYPRVVVVLRQKKGPVKEIAFSTRHPEEVRSLLPAGTGSAFPV